MAFDDEQFASASNADCISFSSYIIEQDACFLTLCDRNFNKKLAYSFLEDLSQEFYAQFGHKINTATRPYAFIEFGRFVKLTKISHTRKDLSIFTFILQIPTSKRPCESILTVEVAEICLL